MFEIQQTATRKSKTVPLAMLGESLVIAALMIIPASHAPIAPILASRITLLAPAPLPPPPPPPAAMRRQPVPTAPKKVISAKLISPVRIPDLPHEPAVALVDAPELASVAAGVPGGVPGGVVGGIPGGVLGGVLGALPPVPPPPPVKAAAAPPPPAAPSRIVVGGDVQAALLIHEVTPKYPRLASLAHVTGTVRLKAIIGGDGRVKDLTLVSGPVMLAQAAEEAVMQWVYKPTLLNGVPYEIATDIDVTFSQYIR